MKHSKRQSDSADQDLAHLQQLRPGPGPAGGPTPGGPGGGAGYPTGGAGYPTGGGVASGPGSPGGPGGSAPGGPGAPTGRAGGDPTAGAGDYGHPLFAEVDRDDVPHAPAGLAVPVASSTPPGAVVGPGGPLTELPMPPAMQYPPGDPVGPLPGQQRSVYSDLGGQSRFDGQMSGTTAVLAPNRIDRAPAAGEWITCPECGEGAAIDPAQRRSEDFCARCDFPLFWARNAVVPLSNEETGASLRRLPGTVGRAATASVACPHCGEPNSPTAIICIRCSQSMILEPEPEPEPEPVYVAPPPPEPEPEPGFPLGWVIAASIALLIITVLVAWIALAV